MRAELYSLIRNRRHLGIARVTWVQKSRHYCLLLSTGCFVHAALAQGNALYPWRNLTTIYCVVSYHWYIIYIYYSTVLYVCYFCVFTSSLQHANWKIGLAHNLTIRNMCSRVHIAVTAFVPYRCKSSCTFVHVLEMCVCV